jgi:hypothetical protein
MAIVWKGVTCTAARQFDAGMKKICVSYFTLFRNFDAASTAVWNPWAEKGAAMADLGDPAWRGRRGR